MPTERRLAAIMFTDIVGYTALMARDEEAGRRARDRHEPVVRPLVERYHGEWIERTGDETLSSFPSALDAVNCSLAVQAELDGDPDLQLRIGIHQGDVTFDEGGVSGDGVNVAARIRPLAKPGGIAISDEVHPSVEGQPHLEFKSLGRRKLRNVRRRVEVYAVSGEAGPAPTTLTGGGVLAHPELRSIAVLPLENLGEPEHERVADGVTDALIESLACIGPELRVVSRTSIMQYKGARRTAREIARELGVELLVEGTALREKDQVLVRLQLIDAERDDHLWAQSYEQEFGGILRLGREIARTVAAEIEIALKPERELLLPALPPVDPEALDLYLRGRTLIGPPTLAARWGPPVIELLERSVALDPDFADAWGMLSRTHGNFAFVGSPASRDGFERAREAAERALHLDEHLGAAHAALGIVRLFHDWDFSGARTAFERAVDLGPSDPFALNGLALYLRVVGLGRSQQDELLERLLRVAPLDLSFRAWHVSQSLHRHEYERGIAEVERIREFAPEFVDGDIAPLYLGLGRPEDAVREMLAWLARLGAADPAREAFRRGSEEGGYEAGLRAIRLLAIEAATQDAVRLEMLIANWSATIGEPEEAMAWLERAYEKRHPALILAKTDPKLDAVRSDPRFDDLMRRIGFPED